MKTLQSLTLGPSYNGPDFSTGVNTKQEMEPQTLQSFKKALGDSIPAISPDPLGRYRLLSALKKRFGPTYRSHPDAASAIHHFDREYNYFRTLRRTLARGGNENG